MIHTTAGKVKTCGDPAKLLTLVDGDWLDPYAAVVREDNPLHHIRFTPGTRVIQNLGSSALAEGTLPANQNGTLETTIASDSFSGGDIADIVGRITDSAQGGTAKTWVKGQGGAGVGVWAIVNGAIVRSTDAGSGVTYGFDAGFTDAEATAKIVTLPASNVRLMVRSSAIAAANQYVLFIQSNGTMLLRKRVGSTLTTLSAGTTPCAVGDVVGLRVTGATIQMLKNGVIVETVTDSEITTGTNFGIYSPSNFALDDIKVRSIPIFQDFTSSILGEGAIQGARAAQSAVINAIIGNVNLGALDGFTAEGWAWVDSTNVAPASTNWSAIVQAGWVAEGFTLLLEHQTSGIIRPIFGVSPVSATQYTVPLTSALSKGAWHHLAGVMNRSAAVAAQRAALYVDGELYGYTSSTPPTDAAAGVSETMSMGVLSANGTQHVGFSALKFYDHALDPAAIRRHYRAGLALL